MLTRTDRYLLPILPAIAAGTCVLVTALGSRALKRFNLPVPEGRYAKLAPYAVAVLLCLWPLRAHPWPGFGPLTFSDVGRIFTYLQEERGWDRPTLVRNLKSPDQSQMVEALALLHPDNGAHPGRGSTASEVATVLKIRIGNLTDPPDPRTIVLSRDRQHALVLVLSKGVLDWSNFQVCRGEEMTSCQRTSLAFNDDKSPLEPACAIPGMLEVAKPQPLVLRVPVRLPPDARAEIWMPRLPDHCNGRVVGGSGERNGSLAGGTDVVLRWDLGGPDCPLSSYRGFPPFFLEATPEDVPLLRALIAPYEELP